MFESGQNWELFGYDMRNVGRHWLAAWRDFLWADDSPVRRRLDEAVVLRTPEGERAYQAGIACGGVRTECGAVLLPDELVLCRTLRLPLAVEPDLDSVLALEVNANSPFSAEDTAYGWHVSSRGEQHLEVVLAIVSMSAVMAYVAQQYGSHDAHAQEVWAELGGAMVVINGFGESKRAALYRRRLLKVAGLAAAACLVLLLTAAASAGFKKLELENLESLAADTQREAAHASRMRAALGQTNETIAYINQLGGAFPSAHTELSRLTQLLGDDTFVERFAMNGLEIDLRGRARDASTVMQLLTEQPQYAEVAAASPIRRLPGTEVEQYHLKIRIQGAQ